MRGKEEASKQTNNKAKQHHTPKAVTFPKKNVLPRVGLKPTTFYILDRCSMVCMDSAPGMRVVVGGKALTMLYSSYCIVDVILVPYLDISQAAFNIESCWLLLGPLTLMNSCAYVYTCMCIHWAQPAELPW